MKKQESTLDNNIYQDYINEIEERKQQGLHPQPIDSAELLDEIINQIKDINNTERENCIYFFIYNVLPGTTAAAKIKADFLKDIILEKSKIEEIKPDFALELLSHMKGGPSIQVLIDLALGNEKSITLKAAKILKTQVFLYEADTDRLKQAFKQENEIAKEVIESYAKAEFFTQLPELEEEIKVVTYVAGIGDISTDLLSPGSDAHSRSDRELHGKSMFEHPLHLRNYLHP